MNFKEYLSRDLVEDAGNLKGLPKEFIKAITGRKMGYDFTSRMGGQNSKIKLYKSNAKRVDITKLARGDVETGFKIAGIVIKINDEWAFLVSYDEIGDGAAKFKLLSAEGLITKDRINTYQAKTSTKGYYRTIKNKYEGRYLKASELPEFIDFKQKVDLYIVTADEDRIAKRQERKDITELPKVSKEKRAAIIRFLQSKSNGIVDILKENIQKDLDRINKYVEDRVDRATSGKALSTSDNIERIMNDLATKTKEIDAIGFMIEDILRDGRIKDHWGSDSWAFRRFKELIKDMEGQIQ